MGRAVLILAAIIAGCSVAEAQVIRVPRPLLRRTSGNAPVAPILTLTAPTDGAEDRSATVSLNYTFSGDCDEATLYLDKSNATTVAATDASCDGAFTSADYDGPLDAESGYVWKVTLCNQGACDTATVRAFTVAAMGARSLLTYADLTCVKKFAGQSVTTGGHLYSPGLPLTYRYVSGHRQWMQIQQNGHINTYDEPTGSTCNTALGSLTPVSNGDATDIGSITAVAGAPGSIPDDAVHANFFFGAHWDETTSRFYALWSPTYGAMPTQANSFAAWTLDGAGHINTRVGCWSLGSGELPPPQRGLGMVDIPTAFVSDHLGTKRLGITGGSVSSPVTSSLGPSMFAIDSPSSNACATDTDYPVPAYVTMMQYVGNTHGPNCAGTDLTGIDIGCTAADPITTPYPARSAWCHYSASNQVQEWECADGVGYRSMYTGDSMGWYDDGTKYGLLSAQTLLSGWMRSAIVSGSLVGSTLTVTLGSLDTHDGGILTVGTYVWVETCTVGLETGCTRNQGQNYSSGSISAVNEATKTVTIPVIHFDAGNGAHAPLVGGRFAMGETYVNGSPWYSRGILWSQIVDPDDVAGVIGGDPVYSPQYVEETSLAAAFTDIGTDFGCPTCTTQVNGYYPATDVARHPYFEVHVDNDAHQIILSFSYGIDNPGGFVTPVFYVFDVN